MRKWIFLMLCLLYPVVAPAETTNFTDQKIGKFTVKLPSDLKPAGNYFMDEAQKKIVVVFPTPLGVSALALSSPYEFFEKVLVDGSPENKIWLGDFKKVERKEKIQTEKYDLFVFREIQDIGQSAIYHMEFYVFNKNKEWQFGIALRQAGEYLVTSAELDTIIASIQKEDK